MTANSSEKISTETSSSLLRRIQAYAFGNRNEVVADNVGAEAESSQILCDLRLNIEKLADASSRLEFMMDEVSSLIRRR